MLSIATEPVSPSELVKAPSPARPSEKAPEWEQFRQQLRVSLEPLARHTGTALALCRDDEVDWITEAPRCDCSCAKTASLAITSCPVGRACGMVDTPCPDEENGRVLICCDRPAADLITSFREQVLQAYRLRELERTEESLLNELSMSWESLEALYQISAAMRAQEETPALLDRVLDRAAGLHEGTRAALWLVNDGKVQPLAARSCHNCATHSPEEGLLGRVLAEQRGILLNGRECIEEIADLEREWSEAESLIAVPIVTPQGLHGALVIWSERTTSRFDARTMHLAETLALQAGLIIESDHVDRKARANAHLWHEVEIGSHIQQALLVAPPPTDLARLQVAALAVPSCYVDGDFYDFYRHSEDILDIVVGDVMGKGIPAALIGAATKNQLLRALSCQLRTAGGQPPGVDAIVTALQQAVGRHLMDLERFVTLCYARFNTTRNLLTFVNCGHTRTAHYQARSGRIAWLIGDNPPLGFEEQEEFRPVMADFEPGDVFVFYSDGLTEAQDNNRDLFGEKRLGVLLEEAGEKGPEELVAAIRETVLDFTKSSSLADDLTCVVVKIAGSPRLTHRTELTVSSSLQSLSLIRAFVHDLGGATDIGAHELDELVLAVNEAASNVMRHAYEGRDDRPVHVAGETDSKKVTVTIRHQGRPFTPPLKPPFRGPAEGGMGLHIIRQCVDEVVHGVEPDGECCVRLVKYVRPKKS